MNKKKIEIEYMKFNDAPETWADRCSGDGYERYVDENGDRRFKDNDESVGIGYRPCAKCREYPTKEGHDDCLGTLGNVMNACCGHGKNEGYVQFDNGIRISGYFKIERI